MVSSDEDIEAFYSDLEDALAKVHNKHIILITEGWNAKLDEENTDWKSVMERYENGVRKERGERLEFAPIYSLYICNRIRTKITAKMDLAITKWRA